MSFSVLDPQDTSMTSVNTNIAAMTALRNLQSTQSLLESAQNRISTGRKINEAKDNAAYWAIATTLKSDNKSLATVKDALGLGSATVDTAYQGLNKAKDVLDEMKSKLTAASQDGVDRSKIQAEIVELQKQLKSIAASSTFSGENWLSVDSSLSSYNANKSVVASMSRDQNGSVTIGTVDVDASQVKLFDASTNADGIVDTKLSMTKADGTTLMAGGLAAGAGPSAANLTALVGSNTGSAGTVLSGAKLSLGTFSTTGITAGDKIKFDLTVDGISNTMVLSTTGLDATNIVSRLQSEINTKIGASKATVALNSTTNELTITTTSTGAASQISAGTISVLDGDGAVTSAAGILGASSLPGPTFGTSAKASASLGTYAAGTQAKASFSLTGTFAGAATVAGTDQMLLNVTWGDVTRNVTVALTTGTAAANNEANIAGQIQTAIDSAFAGATYRGQTYAGSGATIKVKADMTGIETVDKGISQYVSINSLGGTKTFGMSVGTATAATGVNVAAGDTLSFTVQYGSDVLQINKTFQATDFAAGGVANGWVTAKQPTADEWKATLQKVIDNAFATAFPGTSDATKIKATGQAYTAGSDIVVKATSAGALSIETLRTGSAMTIGVTDYKLQLAGATVAATDSRFGVAENSTATSPSGVTGKLGYGKDTAPKLSIGTFDDATLLANDTISMVVNLGGTQKTISIKTDGMVPYVSGTSTATNAAIFQSRVQNALNAQFGYNVVTFTAQDASAANAMTLTTTLAPNQKGSDVYLAISNVTTKDGNSETVNGVTTGLSGMGGLTAPLTAANGTNNAAAATATITGAPFTGSTTIGVNDAITFDVTLADTSGTVTKSVVIDRSRVNTALGTDTGVIGSATALASVLNSAFGANSLGITATGTSGSVVLSRTAGAGAATITVANVQSTSGANLMSVDKIDITDAALASRGVTSANRKDVLSAYISVVNNAINKVSSAASSLGSVASRIEMQKSFVNTLMDTIEKGVSNLVDADLSEESTKLQALQTKSQLGMQALSIANQSAQSILALFRG
ncbi:flagellin [Aureimonas ureilytica]|uniref:flagellin N-terminal helical domain-containing protein n=1 Tax=Aureimonas ureilytica TaxID=401562 RepID=UPI003CF30B60